MLSDAYTLEYLPLMEVRRFVYEPSNWPSTL